MPAVHPWSWAPIQCQQESLVWGAARKGILFRAKQLSCDAARLLKQEGGGQLHCDNSTAGRWPGCGQTARSGLGSEVCAVFQLSQGEAASPPGETASKLPEPEGGWLIWTEVLPPGP